MIFVSFEVSLHLSVITRASSAFQGHKFSSANLSTDDFIQTCNVTTYQRLHTHTQRCSLIVDAMWSVEVAEYKTICVVLNAEMSA